MTPLEQNRQRNRLYAGRDTCERCRRPMPGCYCKLITPLETKTHLVLLQHPRERYVAIGTAYMASLCLKSSELHIGIDWSRSSALARALSNPDRPPILLYPGENAIDIVRDPPPGPVTLVVVDGTWAQTKKVVRSNPILQALPRYAFIPPRPSEYRIRKEPDAQSVATIEALAFALTALEGGAAGSAGVHSNPSNPTNPSDPTNPMDALLTPFRRMIDFQVECQQRFHGARQRHAKHKTRVRRMRVPRALSERWPDVVCVAGEANSWPYVLRNDPTRPRHDELVHWAAYRPATHEMLALFASTRDELAPATAIHTGIDEATLRAASPLSELHAKWRAFIRDTDVVCSWGRYETSLFARSGGFLPAERLDLRHIARDVVGGRVGSLEQFHESVRHTQHSGDPVATTVTGSGGIGRAGRKLDAMNDILASFVALASNSTP